MSLPGDDDDNDTGSVVDDIKASMAEVTKAESAPAPERSSEKPTVGAEAEATAAALRADDKPGPKPNGDGRARGPDGKFVKADADAPAPDGTAAPAAQPGAADGAQAQAGTPASQALTSAADPQPPEHWSQLDKDRFNALPPQIKPLWLEKSTALEKGYQTKFEGLAQKVRAAETIEQVFAPIQGDLQQYGWGPVEATKYLVNYFQNMRADPVGTIQKLAKDYGIDLRTMAASSGAQAPAPYGAQPGQPDAGEAMGYLDPAAERDIRALREQVAPVAQQVQNIARAVQAQAEAAKQAEEQRVAVHVQAFKEAKGQDGKPLHPYYDAVRVKMGNLIAAGEARDLQDAYEQACWAHPEIRETRQRQQEAEWAKKVEAERKADLARARGGAQAPAHAPAPAAVARDKPPPGKSKSHRGDVMKDLLAGRDEAQQRI